MLMTCPKCGQLVSGQTGSQCPKCRIFLVPAGDMGTAHPKVQEGESLEVHQQETRTKAKKAAVHEKGKRRGRGLSVLFLLFAVVISFAGGVFVGRNNLVGENYFGDKNVNYVAIADPIIRLHEGDSQRLLYRVTPADAVHGVAQWESSDPSIASVSDGCIQAHKSGTCMITISVEGKTDEAFVTVLEDSPRTSVNSSNDEAPPSYGDNETEDNTSLAPSYTPSYTPSYSSTNVSDDYKLALFTLAQERVKDQLKSPSSAKFPRNYLGDEVQYERNGDRYTISSWVEAENSFGTMLRQQFMLSTTISGGKMKDIICIVG